MLEATALPNIALRTKLDLLKSEQRRGRRNKIKLSKPASFFCNYRKKIVFQKSISRGVAGCI
jgi:hypothetical protein